MDELRLAPRLSPVGFKAKMTIDDSAATRALVARAVARAQAGDAEAIRFLYVSYAENVYGYVRSILRDDFEAEDITQQVFAKLMTVIGKYDDRGVPFAAWLLRLARNLAIDHVRHKRPIPVEDVHVESEGDRIALGGSMAESDLDQREIVWQAIGSLPEDQRQVVLLRHLVGLTPGEIADYMGRSESSIHGLHHRGRRALQLELVRRESAPVTLGGPARDRLAA